MSISFIASPTRPYPRPNLPHYCLPCSSCHPLPFTPCPLRAAHTRHSSPHQLPKLSKSRSHPPNQTHYPSNENNLPRNPTSPLSNNDMRRHPPARKGDLQRHRRRVARVRRHVSRAARVRRDEDAAAAVDPDVVGARGESDVGQAGEVDDESVLLSRLAQDRGGCGDGGKLLGVG